MRVTGEEALEPFPLVDADTTHPRLKPIFDKMKAKGAGPLHIHRTIAHAPQVYEGFAALATALRQPGATDRSDRELAILRTTWLRQAEYEYIEHKRIALGCGLSQQQVDGVENWQGESCFSPRQRLILRFTDAMMDNGNVDDATRRIVREQLSPPEIIEIAMVAAFYTAVSQFSHTVKVRPEAEASNYGVGDS
jgi:alkylhydroperoxidase family enzyme